ncbi:MAG: hypothetical protein ACI4WR_07130 [Bulleidia sp.]
MSNSIWDAALPEDAGGYKVAKPGKYTFQVEKVTAKEFNPKPTSKIKKCAEIDLQLRVETPDGDVTVFDRLFSDPSTIWKMTAFAKAIGVFKSGMTPGMLMRQCQDGIGQAEICVREYNGKESNEVKSYIEKEPVQTDDDSLPF